MTVETLIKRLCEWSPDTKVALSTPSGDYPIVDLTYEDDNLLMLVALEADT